MMIFQTFGQNPSLGKIIDRAASVNTNLHFRYILQTKAVRAELIVILAPLIYRVGAFKPSNID